MKALIRRNSDPILETMNIPSINWKTGAPLTNPDWYGGPYTLLNDYVPEDPVGPTPVLTVNPDAPVPADDTIVIDGVTYTRAP